MCPACIDSSYGLFTHEHSSYCRDVGERAARKWPACAQPWRGRFQHLAPLRLREHCRRQGREPEGGGGRRGTGGSLSPCVTQPLRSGNHREATLTELWRESPAGYPTWNCSYKSTKQLLEFVFSWGLIIWSQSVFIREISVCVRLHLPVLEGNHTAYWIRDALQPQGSLRYRSLCSSQQGPYQLPLEPKPSGCCLCVFCHSISLICHRCLYSLSHCFIDLVVCAVTIFINTT